MKMIFLLAGLLFFVTARSQYWQIDGNAGTNPKVNYIGTKDNNTLMFRINNNFAGMLDTINHWTSFGYGAGKNQNGNDNTAFGYKAMNLTTNATSCVGIGSLALSSNTTGYGNSALGYRALTNSVNGSSNVAIGNYTLDHSTTGSLNTAVGAQSMYYCTTCSENAALGYGALSAVSSGYGNTGTGAHAADFITSGTYNTASGYQAMQFLGTGSYNTGIGMRALMQIGNSGAYNTGIGVNSLFYNGNSQYNTAIGYNAGVTYDLGWNNTFLGANTRPNGSNWYNCISIGQDVACLDVNEARIGNTATYKIGGAVNWGIISDGRYKKGVQENVKGIDFIMKLRPVTYHLDVTGLREKMGEGRDEKGNKREMDPYTKMAIANQEKQLYSGFIAQEVEQAANKVGYDFSGVEKPGNDKDIYGLRYAEFVVPLVKAVQEQQQQIDTLKKEMDLLKEQNKLLLELMRKQSPVANK